MKQETPEIQIGMIVAFFFQNKLVLGIVTNCIDGKASIMMEGKASITLSPSRIILNSRLSYPPTEDFLSDFTRQTALISAQSISVSIPSNGADFATICQQNGIVEDEALFATMLYLKSHPELYYQKHELFFYRSHEERELFLQQQMAKSKRQAYLNAVSEYISSLVVNQNPGTPNVSYGEAPIPDGKRDVYRSDNENQNPGTPNVSFGLAPFPDGKRDGYRSDNENQNPGTPNVSYGEAPIPDGKRDVYCSDFVTPNPVDYPPTLSETDTELLLSELQQILQGKKVEDIHRRLSLVQYEYGVTDFILLIRNSLGDCPAIPDPALSLSGLPIAFSKAAISANLIDPDFPIATHSAFTIDDNDTKDYDDAISLEMLDNSYRLGIHISHLAAYLSPQHPLYLEASSRISSLYLPSGTVPMLPEEFSEGNFSLKAGYKRAVLSLYASFDQNFQIQNWEWKNQYLLVDKNLSYFEVDKNQQAAEINILKNITAVLKTQRDSMMEKTSPRFYYNFYLDDDLVKLKRIDTQSPARNIIEELMILYNRCMADFATTNQLPMLFRNVSQYLGSNSEVMNSSAFLSSQPGFHPGIGAKAYLHATSPIRRWVDIINQMQVFSCIQDQNPCFDADYLEEIIPVIEKRILDIRDTMHKSDRYWCLKHIEQNSLNQPMEAVFKGYHLGKIKAEILPIGKTILLESSTNHISECFTFVPYAIDWDKQHLKVDILD